MLSLSPCQEGPRAPHLAEEGLLIYDSCKRDANFRVFFLFIPLLLCFFVKSIEISGNILCNKSNIVRAKRSRISAGAWELAMGMRGTV